MACLFTLSTDYSSLQSPEMLRIHTVPSLSDNYIWLIQAESSNDVIVIDPGDEKPVINYLSQQKLNPVAVLITHQHWDHVDGIRPFLNYFDVPVYGPKNELIPARTHALTEQSNLTVHSDFPAINVLDIPGHTAGHIAYQLGTALFCGDTLFSAGCGRLLGGTAEQLFASLQRICQLPEDTLLYCGHEYTEANLQFARAVEPNNRAVETRISEVAALRQANRATLPTTLITELAINPFLRCGEPEVIQSASRYAGHELITALDVFRALRLWKDRFQA